jgi:hypothetical protein
MISQSTDVSFKRAGSFEPFEAKSWSTTGKSYGNNSKQLEATTSSGK